jgi:2-oxoisovalerate dehydrogenase E1 component
MSNAATPTLHQANSNLTTLLATLRDKAWEQQRLLKVLEVMHLSRSADDKMLKLVKQNKGGTFQLSAGGHELIGAVAALTLIPGKDWGLPYYRDQPFAVGLGCDLQEMFGVFLGRAPKNHSGGRMMPYHFSDRALRIPTQSSVVGSQYLPATGLALAIKQAGLDEVVYVSGGDGSTSQGDFHEALNFAGLHQLPTIFVVHDNGWAISVPLHEQTAGGSVAEMIRGRPGIEVYDVDGCNYAELSTAMNTAVARARAGEGASVIVAKVPRLGAHSNSDDPHKYKTDAIAEAERQRDPIPMYEQWLMQERGISDRLIATIKKEATQRVEEAAHEAAKMPFPEAGTGGDNVFRDVSVEKSCKVNTSLKTCPHVAAAEKTVIVDALNQALVEEMERDPNVVVFGEDVARGKGGVFGVTRGLTDRFGTARCFNSPLAESTIVGVALGMSFHGTSRPVAEIQFADYLWPGFDQLVSEVSSIHYRSNGEWSVPIVLRMPYGGYIQGGPYHSQSIEGILAHVPGLKVVIPSNATDAKGLLKAAIRDPNPVIFLEHKALYRQAKFCARALSSDTDEVLPLGQASVVREGSDVTVVGWGMMVVMAMDVANKLAAEGIEVEIIDLRTIVPVDMETVIHSVKKTGKLLVVHEAPRNCGFGAEVAAQVAEKAFEFLDGPIARVCGLDCAVPYSKSLENEVLPQADDLEAGIRQLVSY